MTDTTDNDADLVRRLQDEEERLGGSSIINGCPGCGIAANVVVDSIATIERLTRERDEAVSALPQALRAERRRAEAAEAELARLHSELDEAMTAHETTAASLHSYMRLYTETNDRLAALTAPLEGAKTRAYTLGGHDW